MSNNKQAEQHRSVLVVGPESATAHLEPALQAEGWTVERRATALEAVLPLMRGRFDVMLAHEEAFPCGSDALGEIRRLCPHVAAVTLVSSPACGKGADECLVLPCDLRQITRALARAHECQVQRRLLARAESEHRQLQQKVEEQGARLAALERSLIELSEAAFDLQALFRTALRLFGNATGAGRLSLMLLEKKGGEGELRIVEAHGLSDDVIAKTRLKLGEGVAGWVAQHGRSLLRTRGLPADGQAQDARSYTTDVFLSLPLKLGDEVVGVVNMTNGVGDHSLAQPDLKALSVLAEQTAAWIRYCERLEQARQLSLVDELTSLYNRRYFADALAREVKRAERTGEQLGLAMLDIDHFKLYNDTYGHQAGDRLLEDFARVLLANVRSTDIVCRYGGEEFAIILPETGKGAEHWRAGGVHFVDRLRVAVSEFEFEGRESQPGGRVTVSAGVAAFPHDADSLESLIAAADQMLYEAKRAGRNRVCSRFSAPTSQAKQKTA